MNGPYSTGSSGQALAVAGGHAGREPARTRGPGAAAAGAVAARAVRCDSVNRSPCGNGGSWSGGSARRLHDAPAVGRLREPIDHRGEGKNGAAPTADRNVSKDGDDGDRRPRRDDERRQERRQEQGVPARRRPRGVGRARRHGHATARDRPRTGKARPSVEGAGWEFEGEGKNRYGQEVEAKGYARAAPTAAASSRTSRAAATATAPWAPTSRYGAAATSAPCPPATGRTTTTAALLRLRRRVLPAVPYPACLLPGTCPRRGATATTRRCPVGAIALTIAGMALLYSDGTYYKKTYVEGEDAVRGRGAAGRARASRGNGAACRQDRGHGRGDGLLPVREHVLQARRDERPAELRRGREAGGSRRSEGAARGLRADAGRQHGLPPPKASTTSRTSTRAARSSTSWSIRRWGGAGGPGRAGRAARRAVLRASRPQPSRRRSRSRRRRTRP